MYVLLGSDSDREPAGDVASMAAYGKALPSVLALLENGSSSLTAPRAGVALGSSHEFGRSAATRSKYPFRL